LNCVEFRVTALSSTSRGTSSLTKACHDGMLTPVTNPLKSTRPMISPIEWRSVTHANQSTRASAARTDWVTSSTERRS